MPETGEIAIPTLGVRGRWEELDYFWGERAAD